jgi:ABC-2 type transport system permease protein/lipopolysaccharide transport system permease protein
MFRRRVSLFGSLWALFHAREMVFTLTERELRVRYKQAILGVAWALLQPVTLAVTFTFFVAHTVSNADLGNRDVPYALFAVVGLIPWTFFAAAVGQGCTSLLLNLQLVNKISCPREVFPLSIVGVAGVDACVSLVAVALLFVVKQTTPSGLGLVWSPVLILIELCFTAGVTLMLAGLIVHLRDIRHVVPVILQMGILATPVIWSYEKLSHQVQVVYGVVNPLGPVIDAWRNTLLYGQAPEMSTLIPAGIASVIYLLVGFRVFKWLEASFADLL